MVPQLPPPAAARRRPRVLLGVLAFAAATALLAGCTAGQTASNGRSSTLVIAENEAPATFDPAQADNSTVDEVVIPAYDTILKYDGSDLKPDLATDYKVSSDGTSVTMTLRSDVSFHDGAKLTAADVVYTLDRLKKLGIGVASLTATYASAKATDDTHVTVTLAAPDASFLAALTRVYVLNSKLVQQNAGSDDAQSWLSGHDAGSGPYTFTSYTANQSAKFAQYGKYWGGFSGQAKSIEFRYLKDAATQASALQSGDVDVAMDIAPADRKSFDTKGFHTDSSPTNVVLYSFFNMKDPTTSNPALREAVADAYDYTQHVKSILLGAGGTVNGPLPSGMQCSTKDDIGQPTFDLAKAKQLVTANNLTGTTLNMVYLEATDEMEKAAALLQSNLKDIGITLNLQAVTYPQFVQLYSSDATRPQMGMIYAFPAFPDASAILYQGYDSKFIGTGQNWAGYSNASVDATLATAQGETDPAKRCAEYLQLEKTVTGDHVGLDIANSNIVVVMSDRVKGYRYQPAHHQTVDVYAIKVS